MFKFMVLAATQYRIPIIYQGETTLSSHGTIVDMLLIRIFHTDKVRPYGLRSNGAIFTTDDEYKSQ